MILCFIGCGLSKYRLWILKSVLIWEWAEFNIHMGPNRKFRLQLYTFQAFSLYVILVLNNSTECVYNYLRNTVLYRVKIYKYS